MQFLGITLLVFAGTSLLAFSLVTMLYDRLFRYRLALRERVNGLMGESNDSRGISLFKDIKRLQSSDTLQAQTWRDQLQQVIDQAGIACSVATILAWSAGVGFLAALSGAWYIWWLGALLSPVGAALPFLFVFGRRKIRQRRLSHQLPDAFAMISRAVKSGQTVSAALQIIAEDFDPPISAEFALCYEQQNLGVSRESALRQLALRTGIMELQIFVVALLVQAKSGGDMVSLLDNLSSMIRKRLKLTDRIRALTGEGRMQALVLIILPLAVLLGITFLAPDYARVLFERPWLIATTVAAQGLGVMWIRRIINFEY